MLKWAVALLVATALVSGPAQAAGKKPPPATAQPEADEDQPDLRDQGPPPAPPKGPPVGFVSPQPAPRFIVLTEQQKRCGVQRRCALDSRVPCPPCWQ